MLVSSSEGCCRDGLFAAILFTAAMIDESPQQLELRVRGVRVRGLKFDIGDEEF